MRAAVVALLALVLGACATVAPPGAAPAARASILSFQIEGRVSVTQGEQRSNAAVAWRHAPGADTIEVFSPLGSQLARLTGRPGAARLELPDRSVVEADSATALSARVFGAPLPLTGLPRWVLGESTGAAVEVSRDAVGRPTRIFEDGWRIEYLEYESPASDALPTLMELARGDLRVRLKVDQWNLER